MTCFLPGDLVLITAPGGGARTATVVYPEPFNGRDGYVVLLPRHEFEHTDWFPAEQLRPAPADGGA